MLVSPLLDCPRRGSARQRRKNLMRFTGFPVTPHSEEAAVVSVPIALEALFRIPTPLALKELEEARVTGLDLLSGRVLVVGEEKAASAPDRQVDQPPESFGGMKFSRQRMLGVKIEDHAR